MRNLHAVDAVSDGVDDQDVPVEAHGPHVEPPGQRFCLPCLQGSGGGIIDREGNGREDEAGERCELIKVHVLVVVVVVGGGGS